MTLREEILAGESAELEFKEARPKEALKYVKTAVAFANGRGGRLIFGVENETRKVVGIDPEMVFREVDAIVDTISNDCEPAISLTTKIANVENRPLIVVEVAPGRHTPYYVRKLGMKDGTYVRVGATTRLAEPAVLKTLLIEGENKSFDLLPVKGRVVTKTEATRTARMMTRICSPCFSSNSGEPVLKASVRFVRLRQSSERISSIASTSACAFGNLSLRYAIKPAPASAISRLPAKGLSGTLFSILILYQNAA